MTSFAPGSYIRKLLQGNKPIITSIWAQPHCDRVIGEDGSDVPQMPTASAFYSEHRQSEFTEVTWRKQPIQVLSDPGTVWNKMYRAHQQSDTVKTTHSHYCWLRDQDTCRKAIAAIMDVPT